MTEKRRYTTMAVNTGGRHGISRLVDGSFEVDVSMPKKWVAQEKLSIPSSYSL